MANTAFPVTESDSLDLRNGQAFKVYTVNHTTGTQTNLSVDQSAVAACELGTNMTASAPGQSAGLAKETSASAGISLAAAGSGVKKVQIASGVASGTYTIVVRFVGSGAGIGSHKAGA